MGKLLKGNASDPIGIFDSGIGGLTVANAIRKELPNERLIYFGDTAHLPYGDKSPDSIKYYSIRIAQFLLSKKCKAIVIACNTASAQAYETVLDFVGKQALVFNVIDPVVEKVTSSKRLDHIGVIGTKGTIKSDIYARKLHARKKGITVSSLATPLLASMIEEGFYNNKISRTIINDYLSRPRLKKIDSLILACTHYPLIRKEVEEFYNGKIDILDTAGIVAEHIAKVLKRNGLTAKTRNPSHEFYVSDFTDSFEKSTSHFFGSKIRLKEASIWK